MKRYLGCSSRDQTGMSMMEVLIGVASLGLLFFGIAAITELRSLLVSRITDAEVLSELMEKNTIDAKVRQLTDLPGDGQCLVRRYHRRTKDLLSQQTISAGSSACGDAEIKGDDIEIYWKLAHGNNINATFSLPGSMKLPDHKASIVEIELVGKMKSSGPGAPLIVLGAIIFRGE